VVGALQCLLRRHKLQICLVKSPIQIKEGVLPHAKATLYATAPVGMWRVKNVNKPAQFLWRGALASTNTDVVKSERTHEMQRVGTGTPNRQS